MTTPNPTAATAPLSPEREAIVRQQQPGEWLSGPWLIREVEGTADKPGCWQVTHQGQPLATLPDWAGNLALWIAETHEDVPELLATLDAERAKVAALEKRVAELETSAAPRLCACGHSRLAHTVPAPHSCFAFGQTCPCGSYKQLPPAEADKQLKENIRASEARRAAEDAERADLTHSDWTESER